MRKIIFILLVSIYFLTTPIFCQSDDTVRTITPSIATTSVLVLPANRYRKGLTIYNNSANSVYLTWGPTSAGTTCTRILATFTQFDMLGPVVYQGQISAIRNAGTGALNITEYLRATDQMWP